MAMEKPLLTKGALTQVGFTSIPRSITFQFNPEDLTRSLSTRSAAEDKSTPEIPLAIGGAPTQTINLSIHLDASDGLNKSNPTTEMLGIYPKLYALELLMYPSTPYVIAQTAALLTGATEIIPPQGPLTLFNWGLKRILPVRIDSINVKEIIHDSKLNPINADVDLSLQVLTYSDFPVTNIGYHSFLTHQIGMEAISQLDNNFL